MEIKTDITYKVVNPDAVLFDLFFASKDTDLIPYGVVSQNPLVVCTPEGDKAFIHGTVKTVIKCGKDWMLV